MPDYPDIALARFAVALLCLALASQKVPALARVAHNSRDYGLLVAFVFWVTIATARTIPAASALSPPAIFWAGHPPSSGPLGA